MCKPSNQMRLATQEGAGGLKRQEQNKGVSDREGIQGCSTGQYENLMCFMSTNTCKTILVETQK